MSKEKKVIIIPCSGVGKSFGTVSRMAAYQVTEDDRPATTQLVPLALLVLGDEEARETVENNPVVVIDGCQLACAKKMVLESGGTVSKEMAVLDFYRQNRELKPQGISQLNEGGKKLASVIAAAVDLVVDELTEEGGKNG
ncbi:MAG: putative zinc-binding protein [Anaerolineaceae bacterium]